MIKLLIVDDHPLVIDGLNTMLKDVGYMQITGAVKSGRDALNFLDEHPEVARL